MFSLLPNREERARTLCQARRKAQTRGGQAEGRFSKASSGSGRRRQQVPARHLRGIGQGSDAFYQVVYYLIILLGVNILSSIISYSSMVIQTLLGDMVSHKINVRVIENTTEIGHLFRLLLLLVFHGARAGDEAVFIDIAETILFSFFN